MVKKIRKGMRKVDAILTADWHLRETVPICRTDDFWETQWDKVRHVSKLQQEHNCPVLHAGDLFHHWKPSPFLIAKAIQILPDKFYTVYGNHDLPYHRMENFDKSGVYTLFQAGIVETKYGCHYGTKPSDANGYSIRFKPDDALRGRSLTLIWHKFVYKKNKPFPDARETDEGYNVLGREDLDRFDLIVTGDNHQSFTVQRNGILLVNPGPITRQTVKDPVPVVYLYNAKDHEAWEYELPHDPDAVSAEHRELAKEEERVMTAFVERLDKDWNTELSYEENMKRFMEKNPDKVPEGVRDIVWKCLEKEEVNA